MNQRAEEDEGGCGGQGPFCLFSPFSNLRPCRVSRRAKELRGLGCSPVSERREQARLQRASGVCFGLSAITKRGIGPSLAERPASLTETATPQ